MIVSINKFDPNPFWNNATDNIDILQDKTCTALFDQNG